MADEVLFTRPAWDRKPWSARQQQILDGWIRMLDVDLELAQKTLRGPTRSLPVPPLELPAYVNRDGVVVAPAIEAPGADEPAEPPAPAAGLRGAYARRAAARRTG